MSHPLKKIKSENAPKAVGPYSQAVLFDRFIFVSGQLPLDPRTGKLVEGGIEASTRQALNNIKAILAEAKSGLESVVKVEVFLKDLRDFQKMNEEYKKHFTQTIFPARQTVEVARLPLDAPIEISCIAILGRVIN